MSQYGGQQAYGQQQQAPQYGGQMGAQQSANSQYGGQQDSSQYGSQQDPSQYGGQQDPSQYGGQQDPSQYGGQQDPSQYGGQQDSQIGGQMSPQAPSSQYNGPEKSQSQYSQQQVPSGSMGGVNSKDQQHLLSTDPEVRSSNKQTGSSNNMSMANGHKAGEEHKNSEHKEQDGVKHDEHKEQNGVKHDEHKGEEDRKNGEEDHKKAMMKGGMGKEIQQHPRSGVTNGRRYHHTHMNALHHMGKAAGTSFEFSASSVWSLIC